LLISSGQQKNKWYSPPSQCMEFSKLQICIQGEPQAGLSSGYGINADNRKNSSNEIISIFFIFSP